MDTKVLEYFLRVVELGSINRAAPTLRLTQPALSRHIGALEHEMGTSLFVRTQSGVQLTDAGTLLSERVRPLLRQIASMKEQVGERAAGQLAIGTPPSWQGLFTFPFVRELVLDHPGVRLRVHEGLSNVLHDAMAAGLLDLAIVPLSQAPVRGYSQTAIIREPIVVVGNVADGLEPGCPVPVGTLEDRLLVLPERPNVLRMQLERAMQDEGLKLRVAVESDTLSICMEMAAQGAGWTVVPISSLHGAFWNGATSHAPLEGQSIAWALWDNEARSHSSAVKEGRRLALALIESVLATGSWTGAESLVDQRNRPSGA